MSFAKRILAVLLVLSMTLAFFGCASKKDKKEDKKEEFETVELTTEDDTEKETAPSEPEFVNPLTGLACDPSLAGKRPIGVMFNNLDQALPQINLSKCDIIYEALAEGGITRLEGVILDYANAGNLGSIRSARPYYVNIARAYDAVYVHAGWSPQAQSLISSAKVDNLNGVNSNFKVNGEWLFWRDQARLNSGYALVHTMLASGDDIAAGIAQKGYRTTLNDAGFRAFHFDYDFKGIGNANSAKKIMIPFSGSYQVEFSYEEDTGLYAHLRKGKAHIDGANNAQIKTENVFIIYANHGFYDSYGRRIITLTGEGKGVYANGGEYVNIIWKRASDDAPFKYYNEDGTELKVSTGTSYVSIVDVKTQPSVTIS